MSKIKAFHWCLGLGAHEGRDLQPHSILSMRLVKHFHPTAELFLHTARKTCENYRSEVPFVRRLTYSREQYDCWPNWRIEHGAHMSDKLRLNVLLSEQPAVASVYMDDDAYCCRNLDYLSHIEGCAMPRLSPFMLTNGVIYAGPNRQFLRSWYSKLSSTEYPPQSFVDYSCRMPHDLPGCSVLDGAKYSGATGDQALYGYWSSSGTEAEAAELVRQSAVVHMMSGRSYSDSKSHDGNTNADLVLQVLRNQL